MRKSLPTFPSALTTILALAGLIGCGNGNMSQEARVRVFHASPDAPNVDVLVDGGRVIEDVPYAAASEFLPLTVGQRQFTVTATGTDTAVIDTELKLNQDTDYLVVAAGKVADIAPIVATVDRSDTESGTARIRVLHSAASAPEVDIYVTTPGGDLTSAQPVLTNVPFRAISDYLSLPVGSYDISVTLAGTKTVAITAKSVAITDGLIATVAALDAAGGGAPFSLNVLDER